MQGEPVTLSNIESSIKKGLNEKDNENESVLTRIILFPFRIVAAILTGIANILGPLMRVVVDIFRIAIGISISAFGFFALVTLVIVATFWFGIISTTALPEWSDVHNLNLPFEPMRQAFPTWTMIFVFLGAAIPALFIMLLGNSIIAKKIVFHAVFGWTLFVLFFVSLAYLAFTIPQLIYSFKEDAEYKTETTFPGNGKTATLKLRESGLDDYKVTDLSLRGYEGNEIKLVEHFSAQGPTKMSARDYAQQIDYHVVQTDSVITFDSNVSFKKDAKFRFQRLNMDLLIPYDRIFAIDGDAWNLISNHWRHEFKTNDELQRYKISKNGKLKCISCPPADKDMSGLSPSDQFGLKDFNEIEMSGLFDVVIQQGDEYAIELEGNDTQKKNYSIDVSGETLKIAYHTRSKDFWTKNAEDNELVKLTITLPRLQKLKVKGAGKLKVRGFDENEAKISLTGAMVADARISANQMYIEMAGPVVLELDGHGQFLEASISGTAQLRASNYEVDHGIIDAHGLGQARVNVTGTLEIEKDFTSSVHYSGNPNVIKRD